MSEDVLSEVGRLKNMARWHRESGRPAEAAALFDRAAKLLEDVRAAIPREGGSLVEGNIARELADCYGSLGGAWRSAGFYDKAVDSYDRGYTLEGDEKYRIVSSYNLVQCLVARMLLQPDDIGSNPWVVKEKDVWRELEKAEAIIQGQLGLRVGDPWVRADRLLVVILLLRPEPAEPEAWKEFQQVASVDAIESTLRAISEILERMKDAQSTTPRFHEIYHRLRGARERLETLS